MQGMLCYFHKERDMSIKMKDVLDAIDHRGRQVHEGEMGLWVRASEWDLVREALRHSSSEFRKFTLSSSPEGSK